MTTLATTSQQRSNKPSHAAGQSAHVLSDSSGSHANDEQSTAPSSFSLGDESGGLSEKSLQEEKDFIAAYQERHSVLQPEEIAQHPKNKLLGSSSKNLSVNDFELLKTVGTGKTRLICAGRSTNCGLT